MVILDFNTLSQDILYIKTFQNIPCKFQSCRYKFQTKSSHLILNSFLLIPQFHLLLHTQNFLTIYLLKSFALSFISLIFFFFFSILLYFTLSISWIFVITLNCLPTALLIRKLNTYQTPFFIHRIRPHQSHHPSPSTLLLCANLPISTEETRQLFFIIQRHSERPVPLYSYWTYSCCSWHIFR